MSSETTTGGRLLISTAAFVVVIAGMRAAESLIILLLLSIFIAIISAPTLFWLHRKGLHKLVAMLVVILAIAGVGLLLSALIGSSIDDFSRALPAYKAQLQEHTAGLVSWMNTRGIALPADMVKENLNLGSAMSLAAKMFSSLSNLLANAFFILITVIFILLEASSFPRKLQLIFRDPESSMAHFNHLMENVNRYVAMKSWMSLLTGSIIAIYLWILGVDYALLWGILAFVLNFVPNIGSIIAAIPAVLLAFVQGGSSLAMFTIAGYAAVNIAIGNVLEPKIMGKGLGLSTLVVFLSLVFWGWVLGPVGMLLSVPLTMVVKVALESEEQTHWIAVLLGSEADVKAAEAEDRKEQSDE